MKRLIILFVCLCSVLGAKAQNHAPDGGLLMDLLKNVYALSRETVCDGAGSLPYAAFGGVTVSGK